MEALGIKTSALNHHSGQRGTFHPQLEALAAFCCSRHAQGLFLALLLMRCHDYHVRSPRLYWYVFSLVDGRTCVCFGYACFNGCMVSFSGAWYIALSQTLLVKYSTLKTKL